MNNEYYTLSAECQNCGWTGTKEIRKGIKVIGFNNKYARDCPHCECETLIFGKDPIFKINEVSSK